MVYGQLIHQEEMISQTPGLEEAGNKGGGLGIPL